MFAGLNKHAEVVKTLLENGAQQEENGVCARMCASNNGHDDVKILLENGAQVDLQKENGCVH